VCVRVGWWLTILRVDEDEAKLFTPTVNLKTVVHSVQIFVLLLTHTNTQKQYVPYFRRIERKRMEKSETVVNKIAPPSLYIAAAFFAFCISSSRGR
jgi:hypothetical protein